MDFWKVYIKDYVFTTPSNICDRAFYENNEVLSETGSNRVEIVLNILAYSNIISIFRDYPGLFRYIQKPVYSPYIQKLGIFRTPAYLAP